jgi:hypothetical protein
MPSFDKAAFATALSDNALPPFGQGKCAKFVRLALEAAGMNTAGHPISAKDWGPTLSRLLFQVIPPDSYRPRQGDIVVIQSTSTSFDGHMQGFNGTQWISDFKQREFWPGPSFRTEKPAFIIYRRNVP